MRGCWQKKEKNPLPGSSHGCTTTARFPQFEHGVSRAVDIGSSQPVEPWGWAGNSAERGTWPTTN